MEKETYSPPNPPKEEREKIAYFKPSEMVFVLGHPSDKVPTEQEIDDLLGDQNSGGVIGWSYQLKENDELVIKRVKDRELHFPGTTRLPPPPPLNIQMPPGIKYESPKPVQRTAFSIIPVDVRVPADINHNPEGLVDTDELARLVTRFDQRRESLEKILNVQRDESQRVTVEVITPNWLSVPSMSEYGGGGGPGSRPVPYTETEKPGDAPSTFCLPDGVTQLCPEYEMRGDGVKVAILDTAPCLHDIVEAYELYQKVRPNRHQQQRADVGPHPIIETLLKPGGPLHLHPATMEELYRMRAVHLRDHDYIMTDHGLFVAGIIHSIAPAAEIHLYEVLNPQGAGDLESIARGLWKVFDEQYWTFLETGKYQPLVVNCSLMLCIPLDGDPDNPDVARVIPSASPLPIVGHRLTDLDQAMVDQIRNDLEKNDFEKFVVRSGSVIMWICDLLYYLGARVIAASGNDWDPSDEGRPETRYPAAFERVLGVGALPKGALETDHGKRKPSSFSNISDDPGRIGVATLGGEPGKGNGVLGIYLGKFPPAQSAAPNDPPGLDNVSHLAWWAGTSFATPIVSGAVAAVLSGPRKPATTENAIALMYQNGGIVNNQTEYEEDLLDVSQEKVP